MKDNLRKLINWKDEEPLFVDESERQIVSGLRREEKGGQKLRKNKCVPFPFFLMKTGTGQVRLYALSLILLLFTNKALAVPDADYWLYWHMSIGGDGRAKIRLTAEEACSVLRPPGVALKIEFYNGNWSCILGTAPNVFVRGFILGRYCSESQIFDRYRRNCFDKGIGKGEGRACSSKGNPSDGNPITIANGNKYQYTVDYTSHTPFPLSVTRAFNSMSGRWNFFPEVQLNGSKHKTMVLRPDGKKLPYIPDGTGGWVSDADVVGTLTATEDSSGNITGWTYITRNDQVEAYDAQGRILSVTKRSGLSHSYSYQTDSITVSHTNGDTLVYQLDSEGRVAGFTDPATRTYQYGYDTEGRLVSITFPDNTPDDATDNPQRVYHYENSTFPYALTGITDENGNRYASWSYDSEGRAVSSEHAGGVDKVTIDYTYQTDSTDPRVTVTNALGKQTTYHFTTILGVRKVTQVEGHPTASCEGANKAYSYDANGNVTSKTDWKGVTTTYTYDMERNLELSRTEAVGTPQERSIITEWHPDYRLPTKITEPGRITEYTYDAQGRQLTHNVRSAE